MGMTEPIRKIEDIKINKQFYYLNGRWRDYALLVVRLNMALRINDLLLLRWKQVYYFEFGHFNRFYSFRNPCDNLLNRSNIYRFP